MFCAFLDVIDCIVLFVTVALSSHLGLSNRAAKLDGICDRDHREPDTARTAVQEEVAEEATSKATESMLALPHENVISTTQ